MSSLSVLALTNLFPSNKDPGHAPFNRQQFAALSELASIEVLGVVPLRASLGVVWREEIDGIRVAHPRFFSIPGVPSLNAGLYAASVFASVAARVRKKRYDVLLAAYAYPDGCAGVALGRAFGLPVVVKCHGSDLNRVVRHRAVKVQLERLLPRASRVVCVSKKLGERARELGVREDRLSVVYNGVDRARFFVRDRGEARARLRLPRDRELVVYVGHLAEHKGARDLLGAVKALMVRRPGVLTAFVGDGPMAREVAETQGVLAPGRVTHAEVAEWISACDLLCLPSWDEGMPNVVREAHASGRPVVATAVGGIPEAVYTPELGALVPPRNVEALAAALERVLASPRTEPERILELGIVPTWKESAASLLEVLESVRRS